FCNGHGAAKHVGCILEHAGHFVGALNKKLVAMKLQTVRILYRLASLHADQHVMSLRVVFTEIVAVIGSHHGDPELLLQAEEVSMDPVFKLQALVLYLEKKLFFAKEVAKEPSRLARGLILPLREPLRYLSL